MWNISYVPTFFLRSLLDGFSLTACYPQAVGRIQKNCDEETNDKDVSGKAEILIDATIKDVGPTLSFLNISSEHHAAAYPNDSTLVQSDTPKQDADDSALSG
jgi:hypothetical protein